MEHVRRPADCLRLGLTEQLEPQTNTLMVSNLCAQNAKVCVKECRTPAHKTFRRLCNSQRVV